MGKEGEFRNEVTHQIHAALFFSLPSCEPDVCLCALRPSQQTPEDRRWNWWPSTRLLGWSSLWIMNIVLTFSLAQDFRLSSTLGSLRIYRGDMKYHTKLCALQHSSQMQMDEGISRPLAAEEMVAGWKSWAKAQPGREAVTMATVAMAILLQPAITPLRGTSQDVSLSYSGLGFGWGKFNFYPLSPGENNTASFTLTLQTQIYKVKTSVQLHSLTEARCVSGIRNP